MTNEEAIKILSNRDGFGIPTGYTSGYAEAIEVAIEALKAEPRWIPVTERLPETDGIYLITDASCGYEDVHESFYFPNADEYGEPYWDYNNVTAWMPMPEPYREVEE